MTETRYGSSTTRGPRSGQAGLERLKWIALASMTVDHVGWFLLLPADLKVLSTVCFVIGDLAFPLFAWIIAHRLIEKPDRWRRYLPRLVAFALIAQPVYAVVRQDTPGLLTGSPSQFMVDVYAQSQLNIFITLAIGLSVASLILNRSHLRNANVLMVIAATIIGIAFVIVAPVVDYGMAGALMIPVFVIAVQTFSGGALMILAMMTLVVNLDTIPITMPAALTLPFIVQRQARVTGELARKRLPFWAFYVYYPAHLAGIALIAHLAGVAY